MVLHKSKESMAYSNATTTEVDLFLYVHVGALKFVLGICKYL